MNMDTSVSESPKESSATSRSTEENSEIHQPPFELRLALPCTSDFYQETSQEYLQELLDTKPHEFKRCKLKMLRHDLAYAKPVSEPTLLIEIIGRDAVGRSFPGDDVCVQIVSRKLEPKGGELLTGKVEGLMKRDEERCTFICNLDENNERLAIPIKKNMTKIFIIQKTPHKIEIRKFQPNSQLWVTEKLTDITEGQLLLVKVIKWEYNYKYPLGVVTKVLSQDDYLSELFQIEFAVKGTPPSFQISNDNGQHVDRENFDKWKTFTIDDKDAHDLDDAISLRDSGETYVIAVHITDVASYVTKDSKEDIFAREQGRTFYPHHKLQGKPVFMFSEDLRSKHLSLIPDEERRAISLITVINKATNMIESSYFTLSHIRSNRRFSYEEADRIIQDHCLDNAGPLCFSTVEDCVAVAYHFTKMHRKCRLNGAWGSGQQKGKSRAHCMVQELMHLYNSAVAEELISRDLTRDITPLRCHPGPDHEELEQFIKKHSALLPLSHLSHISEDFQKQENYTKETACIEVPCEETDNIQEDDVLIMTPVFHKMVALAQTRDYHNLVHLIISDTVQPKLYRMAEHFMEIQSKADILRSCSSLYSKLGHFNLKLNAYTWASSPMRRYLDIILQRLLHSAIFDKQKQSIDYTQREIDQFCESGMECLDCAKNYDLQATSFITTTKLSYRVVTKLAVVDQLFPEQHSHMFTISFPDQVSEKLTIMYRHLKLVEQPEYNNDKKSITLRWKRRVYTYHGKTKSMLYRNVIPISIVKWKQIISAVKIEDWDKIKGCLEDVSIASKGRHENQKMEACSKELQHFKEFNMELKSNEVLQVQLGTEIFMNTMAPKVKLLNINPFFEVCLEHARNPALCFSKDAKSSTKATYCDCKEYQDIWGKLCQMDTAYNAVEENNSVILENVPITWTENADLSHKGFFSISQDQKKEWHLEFDLTNCFLCIRLRGQHVDTSEETEVKQSNDLDLSDQSLFTWVAHAVTTKAAVQVKAKKKKEKNEIKTHFQINYQSMKYIPPKVFDKDTSFTVEIIPKKIPYMLQEHAIANIKKANDLVKGIATGDISHNYFSNDEQLHPVDDRLKLPHLNKSQERAVQEALKKPFTVIQGPPGTGKTVVGVHITYQFYLKNKMLEAEHPKCMASPEKKNKKLGILYCGPSNKSVDIVAEQLLKLKGVLNPLRIYCDQTEMMEFPYPGSDLKLCRKSLRDEKPKKELRDITLMYLVRKPENPYSKTIKEFEEGITEFNSESYKEELIKAQECELLKHDVILCTCSTALKPILTKTMDFQQILIDECAMATEPEAFIPLVSHNPKQIVLMGDHKQVRPIVSSARVKELGMGQSLFERYMDLALMLDTQYRMHESICKFPSEEFYGGRLKTGSLRRSCFLLNSKNKPTAILFGHVEGKEISLAVSTAAGNENSVANELEAEQAVHVADLLISRSGVPPENIAILTPYNAQMSTIKKMLTSMNKGFEHVSVCTIMKSQGSEWPYVIVSMVRSCPLSEIQNKPNDSKGRLRKKLGFVTDPNQVNVAITRAQDGLCILGNKHLLECSELWRKLLSHYQAQHCVLNPAQDIKVQHNR